MICGRGAGRADFRARRRGFWYFLKTRARGPPIMMWSGWIVEMISVRPGSRRREMSSHLWGPWSFVTGFL